MRQLGSRLLVDRSLPWRAGRFVTLVAILYVGVGWFFASETASLGLLSPGGSPRLGVVALGLVYLGLRVAFRFLVPAIVTYVGVDALFRRIARRGVRAA